MFLQIQVCYSNTNFRIGILINMKVNNDNKLFTIKEISPFMIVSLSILKH